MSNLLEMEFLAASGVAGLGWAILVFAPRWRPGVRILAPVVIPGLLAILYAACIVAGLPHAEGGFLSLEEVAALLGHPVVLLGGWIHYLAFDLVVGSWEVRDARDLRIPHAVVIPCLVFTFMMGPVGFLAYNLVRMAARRRVAV
jgi:hypothetical protein